MSDIKPIIHKTVLIEPVLTYLDPKPNKMYVDVTFGSGGHTRAILEKEPHCTVIAVDWDKISLDTYATPMKEEFGNRFIPLWGNFAQLYKLLKSIRIDQVDGILADFGTSQMHLFERAGFSVRRDSPLDMRMSPSHQKITAADILNKASEQQLSQIFWEFGEERFSRKIAHAIVEDRGKKPFRTTLQLADLIERIISVPPGTRIHPATRVFQALRIYINKELDNIKALLAGSLDVLADDGRLVCISFHSLEDRIVKQFFQEYAGIGRLEILTKRAIAATPEEVDKNPSSRSAKLRAARFIRRG